MCDVINKIINGQNKIIDDQNIIKQELFILKNQKKDAPVNINKMEESVAKLTTSVNNLSKYSQKVEDVSPCPPERPSQDTVVASRPTKSPSPSVNEPVSKRAKVCIIGDSVIGKLDHKIISKAMDTEIKAVRAYSTLEDTMETEAMKETKYPDRRFQDIMKKEGENSVQATSVDISNMKASHDNSKRYSEFFKQETMISASNLFTTVENTIKMNPKIKKAIILKQTPRYDGIESDPLSVKAALR